MKKSLWAMFILSLLLPTASGQTEIKKPDASAIQEAVEPAFATHRFAEVAIAPDGNHVAWVTTSPEAANQSETHRAIFVQHLQSASGRPERISAGNGPGLDEHDVDWSPDGRHLAFLSNFGNKMKPQLYVFNFSNRVAKKLGTSAAFIASPRWSPDGKEIAFFLIDQLSTKNEAANSSLPAPSPAVAEQRLAVVNLSTNVVRVVTPPDLFIYEFSWSPDGKRFAVTAAPGDGDANWWTASLYVVDATSGETKQFWKPNFQIVKPCWSPDGKNIAIISGLMSDSIAPGGDIYILPLQGGAPVDVTPSLKASATWVAWKQPDEILFTEIVDGHAGIATVRPSTHQIETKWNDTTSINTRGYYWEYALSLTLDGQDSAVIRQSFQDPPEIWAGPNGNWKQVTHANADLHPIWGRSESLHWENDHNQVQGWLLYPRNFKADEKYPMVVLVHGGPAGASVQHWPEPFYEAESLAAFGYFVFYPNPRGSLGAGEAFTQGNVKDFGYGDLRDILTGVDRVVRSVPVDNDRIGITGWSYGGYMAMWAITQTNMFRASVAGPGVSNWESYYGQVDIEKWLIPYFGASVYQDPDVYERSSPIRFIKNVRTPTLFYVGGHDTVCPASQTFELWRALKRKDVDTQLILYPTEGHGITQPKDQRDVTRQSILWFDKYLVDRRSR